jgi:hypothetical protein
LGSLIEGAELKVDMVVHVEEAMGVTKTFPERANA